MGLCCCGHSRRVGCAPGKWEKAEFIAEDNSWLTGGVGCILHTVTPLKLALCYKCLGFVRTQAPPLCFRQPSRWERVRSWKALLSPPRAVKAPALRAMLLTADEPQQNGDVPLHRGSALVDVAPPSLWAPCSRSAQPGTRTHLPRQAKPGRKDPALRSSTGACDGATCGWFPFATAFCIEKQPYFGCWLRVPLH